VTAAASLTACRFLPALRPAPPQRVLVVGGGLAGLSCGLDLARAGHGVTVLEASGRAGGRVLTVRGFRDRQWAEAGAELFGRRDLAVMSWASELGLALAPTVRSLRLWLSGAFVEPDDPMAAEAWLTWRQLPERAGRGAVGYLDRLTLAEWLAVDPPPPRAVEIFRCIVEPLLGAPIEEVSALWALREAAAWRDDTFHLRAGADTLSDAMASRLGERLRLNTAVLSIAQAEAGVELVTHTGEHLTGDRAVLAIPPPALARIGFDPPLSEAKSQTLAEISMAGALRTILQFKRRVWRRQESSRGDAITDLPIQHIHEATAGQLGDRGILTVHTTGPEAESLRPLQEREEQYRVLAQVDQVWPGVAPVFELGATHDWAAQPWIGGMRSVWRPGQLLDLQPGLARPEGRLHFAGEHTQDRPGTMEAALVSGRRAAWEITNA
jgi:monoamine oxidase